MGRSVIHFDDEMSLREWLDSSVRAQWVERLQAKVGDFELRLCREASAVVCRPRSQSWGGHPPPSWKMALTVLLGLYPTVMLLTLFSGGRTRSPWDWPSPCSSATLSV